MKKQLLQFSLVAFFSLLLGVGHAQVRQCASQTVYESMMQTDPQFVQNQAQLEQMTNAFIKAGGSAKMPQALSGTPTYTIPVVFHVVYANSTQNISDAQIQSQLDVLNEDFQLLNADKSKVPSFYSGSLADVKVQFCMAKRDPQGNATNGIVRKSTTVSSFSSNNAVKFSSQGGSNAWPRDSYLNIWVCNLGGGLLGYAQFPGGTASTDGVVVLYSATGRVGTLSSSFDLGRTATHEVGHWLNLRHIWGDANCGSDLVTDTPVQPSPNYGCPSSSLTTSCSANSGQLMMWMNYMDYTDDRCMYMFTTGQKDRMYAVLQPGGTRAALASSQGCVAPGPLACAVPSGLSASSLTQTGATLNWASVTGAASYQLQWKANSAANFTVVAGLTGNTYNLSGLSAATGYQWQIKTNCTADSSAYSALQSFTTASVCNTDIYEANNSTSAAKTLSMPASINALIGNSTDNDYFKVTTTSAARNLKVTLSNLAADYNLQLLDSRGKLLRASVATGTANETVVFNSTKTATYFIRVFGKNGAFNASSCYGLQAISGGTSFRTAEEEEQRLMGSGKTVKIYPNPVQVELTLLLSKDWKGNVQVTISDLAGRRLMTRTVSASGVNQLDVSQLKSGLYIVRTTDGESTHTQKVMIQQ